MQRQQRNLSLAASHGAMSRKIPSKFVSFPPTDMCIYVWVYKVWVYKIIIFHSSAKIRSFGDSPESNHHSSDVAVTLL
jgi:hypothetical protein